MKKSVWKQTAAVAMAAVMGLSLVACGGGGAPSGGTSADGTEAEASKEGSGDAQASGKSGEKTVVTFSFDQGVGGPTQEIVDKYNASQDEIEVKTILLPQDANAVHDDFVNKLASGDTSVDIMGLDVVYVAEFASAGWLAPLDSYFDQSVLEGMIEGTVEGGTYDGKLVAMPWFTNSSAMFYRQDVLEALGEEAPSTYEGWMALADKAVGTEGVEYGADFQAAQSEALVCNWCEFVWANGGDILDADGKPVANSANNVEATQIMKDLVDKYAPDGITTYTETESEQLFKEGKALYLRDWSGFWSSGQDEGSKVTGKVGVTELPVGPSGSASHSCLGGLDLVINNHISDSQKAAAAEFIRYMVSEETQKEMTLISAQPPVVKSVYQDADVLKEIPFYADFYDIIQNGKSRPKSPRYAKVSDAIQRNIHQALTGEMEVQEALDKLQAELEELSN